MKSRIHNIFSETGCVQKDILLKYRDRDLNDVEKHDVERHLIDCELCSDALEGLALLTSAKILDEISSEVQHTVKSPKGINISPQWRTILIAASISFIAFLSFYTVKQFEQAKTPENILTKIEEQTKPELITPNQEEYKNAVSANALDSSVDAPMSVNSEVAKLPKATQPSNVTFGVSDADYSDPEPAIEEIFIAEDDSEMELLDEVIDAKRADSDTYTGSALSLETNELKNQEFPKKENLGSTLFSTNTNVGYINDHKIYSNSAPLLKDSKPVVKSKSLNPKYENKTATTLEDKPTIVREELTYEQVLELALIDFENKRYEDALAKLKLIEQRFPNDLNVDFYSGMSNYNLSNFSDAITTLEPITKDTNKVFNEEAEFYTALSHYNLGNTRKGVKMLEKISSQNNFYSPKAKEFLENNKK